MNPSKVASRRVRARIFPSYWSIFRKGVFPLVENPSMARVVIQGVTSRRENCFVPTIFLLGHFFCSVLVGAN